MNTLKYQREYRRRLPHLQPPGATFFITFRLAGSIPQKAWEQLRKRLDEIYRELSEDRPNNAPLPLERERLWFREYEEFLHKTNEGPVWLQDDRVAALVAEDFHHFDRKLYRLTRFASCRITYTPC